MSPRLSHPHIDRGQKAEERSCGCSAQLRSAVSWVPLLYWQQTPSKQTFIQMERHERISRGLYALRVSRGGSAGVSVRSLDFPKSQLVHGFSGKQLSSHSLSVCQIEGVISVQRRWPAQLRSSDAGSASWPTAICNGGGSWSPTGGCVLRAGVSIRKCARIWRLEELQRLLPPPRHKPLACSRRLKEADQPYPSSEPSSPYGITNDDSSIPRRRV